MADKEKLSSMERFAERISGYAGITELNFRIIHQLIEKILVSETVEIDGQKIQRLTIHYKFMGHWNSLKNGFFQSPIPTIQRKGGRQGDEAQAGGGKSLLRTVAQGLRILLQILYKIDKNQVVVS